MYPSAIANLFILGNKVISDSSFSTTGKTTQCCFKSDLDHLHCLHVVLEVLYIEYTRHQRHFISNMMDQNTTFVLLNKELGQRQCVSDLVTLT